MSYTMEWRRNWKTMKQQVLNMLGLARRAGSFVGGHDAAFESIAKGKAALCFLTTDASERLKKEFRETVQYEGRAVPLLEPDITMREIERATGQRCAVFTVTDAGFASKLTELLSKEDKEEW